jgi:hypothetical protein
MEVSGTYTAVSSLVLASSQLRLTGCVRRESTGGRHHLDSIMGSNSQAADEL